MIRGLLDSCANVMVGYVQDLEETLVMKHTRCITKVPHLAQFIDPFAPVPGGTDADVPLPLQLFGLLFKSPKFVPNLDAGPGRNEGIFS